MWEHALLMTITVMYAIQGVIYLALGQQPQALILASYAVANVGLIWSFAR